MKKNLDFLKHNLIAHRGMHNEKIPENTLEAFSLAIKNNYIIELDVHILKDNNIVVFHDDNLKRMTNIDKNIKDLTYKEIKNLNIKNTNCKIPLFKDVLNLVDGEVPIIIELKNNTKSRKLEKETMNLLKNYSGKFAIKSFNSLSIYWIKRNYPNVIIGQLTRHSKKDLLNDIIFKYIVKPDFISIKIKSLTNKKVKKYKSKKLILGWTVKTKEEMNNSKKYCDNLICENLDLM